MGGCEACCARFVAKAEKFCLIFKGLLTRLLFIFHASLSIFLLHSSQKFEEVDAYFLIPIGALVIESVTTLYSRSGKEFKYVWMCGFLYITALVPMIWVLELDLLATRQNLRTNPFAGDASNTTTFFASESDILFNALRLSEIDGRKFCEIGGIICLIAGRWLAPRGAMSRNQMSTLLLGYAANAADILELFESFQSPKIVYDTNVTMCVLAIYTWALLQFALVTTATPGNSSWKKRVYYNNNRDNKCGATNDKCGNGDAENGDSPYAKHDKDAISRNGDNSEDEEHMVMISTGEGEVIATSNNKKNCNGVASNQDEIPNGVATTKATNQEPPHKPQHNHNHHHHHEKPGCCVCHPEYPQLLVTFFMQDGPFLLLRLVLTIKYGVINELFIFFLCKNAIACILLVHRLLVLRFEKDTSIESLMREYEAGVYY